MRLLIFTLAVLGFAAWIYVGTVNTVVNSVPISSETRQSYLDQ